jgi:hypothetical protein
MMHPKCHEMVTEQKTLQLKMITYRNGLKTKQNYNISKTTKFFHIY